MVDDNIQTVGLANEGQRTSESGCSLAVRVAVLCVIEPKLIGPQSALEDVRACQPLYGHHTSTCTLSRISPPIVLVFACKFELITYFAIQATYATQIRQTLTSSS
jgi:hypothetical protein